MRGVLQPEPRHFRPSLRPIFSCLSASASHHRRHPRGGGRCRVRFQGGFEATQGCDRGESRSGKGRSEDDDTGRCLVDIWADQMH